MAHNTYSHIDCPFMRMSLRKRDGLDLRNGELVQRRRADGERREVQAGRPDRSAPILAFWDEIACLSFPLPMGKRDR